MPYSSKKSHFFGLSTIFSLSQALSREILQHYKLKIHLRNIGRGLEWHWLGSLSGKARATTQPRPGRAKLEQKPRTPTSLGHRQQRCCWLISDARRSYFCKPQQAQEFKSLPGNPCHMCLALPWCQGQLELNRDEIISKRQLVKLPKCIWYPKRTTLQ